MTASDHEAPPVHGPRHDALSVFLGEWRAEGRSYGAPDQDKADPKARPETWASTHVGKWHTGEFFLIQDERALIGDGKAPFDTLSVMGVDVKTGKYFARSFENHGFTRQYDVQNDGRVWTFTGPSERARITFSADGATQTIVWQWRPDAGWLPLCDRTAVKLA